MIVVDALGRCRPDYALALLKITKHFFAVDYLQFELGGAMSANSPSPNFMYLAITGRIEPEVAIQCRGPYRFKLWFRIFR